MSSQSAGNLCDLCGKVCLGAAALARHRDSGVCRKAQIVRQRTNAGAPDHLPAPVTQPADDLSSLLRKLRQSSKILPRIPKGARHQFTECLIDVLDAVATKNDTQSWSRLFTFTYSALSMPSEPDKRESTTTVVKRNLTHPLDLQATTTPQNRPAKNKLAVSHLRKAVERKFQDGDVSGAVRLLSSEDAVALPSPEVLPILQAKHPAAYTEADYPPGP